jgi:AhpD family alkylhydroperoxidase
MTAPSPRFNPGDAVPTVFASLVRASKHPEGPVPDVVLELAALRVSLRNGCAFCCDLHGRRAAAAGASELVLRALPGWRELPELDDVARAALSVAEVLTTLDHGHDPGPVLDAAQAVLGPEGLAQVAASVAAVSAWNRLLIAAGVHPDPSYS